MLANRSATINIWNLSDSALGTCKGNFCAVESSFANNRRSCRALPVFGGQARNPKLEARRKSQISSFKSDESEVQTEPGERGQRVQIQSSTTDAKTAL